MAQVDDVLVVELDIGASKTDNLLSAVPRVQNQNPAANPLLYNIVKCLGPLYRSRLLPELLKQAIDRNIP